MNPEAEGLSSKNTLDLRGSGDIGHNSKYEKLGDVQG